MNFISVMSAELWYCSGVASTKSTSSYDSVVQCRDHIAINSTQISSTIEIAINSTTSQVISYVTCNGSTKLCPPYKWSSHYIIINTIRLIEHFIFKHIMIALGCIILLVNACCVKRIECVKLKITTFPITRPWSISIIRLFTIITGTTISSTKVLTKDSICCIRGNSLSDAFCFGHLAHHWTTTIFVINNTIVDGYIDTTCNRFSWIHTTSVEFVYYSMVYLEGNITINLFVTRSCDSPKSAAIDITMRIICIYWFVRIINTREVEFWEVTTYGIYSTMTNRTFIIWRCVIAWSKTAHTEITSHNEIVRMILCTIANYYLLKLSSVKNHWAFSISINTVILKLSSVHKCSLSNLKMTQWHHNTNSIRLRVCFYSQSQFGYRQEIKTYRVNSRTIRTASKL